MAEISNEVLMAYVDGELDVADRQRVEAALATDAGLRALAEEFRATRQPLQGAFDHILREPVPSGLVDLIRNHGRAGAASIVSLDQRRQTDDSAARAGAKVRSFGSWRMAAGVALLMLAGGALWRIEGGAPAPAPDAPAARWAAINAALVKELDTAPSRRSVDVKPSASGDSVRIIATLPGKDNRYCRQYRISLGVTDYFEGLACRGDGTGWVVEHQLRRAGDAVTSRGLEPASKQKQTETRKDPLEEAIDAATTGSRLDDHEELALIKRGWTGTLPERR